MYVCARVCHIDWMREFVSPEWALIFWEKLIELQITIYKHDTGDMYGVVPCETRHRSNTSNDLRPRLQFSTLQLRENAQIFIFTFLEFPCIVWHSSHTKNRWNFDCFKYFARNLRSSIKFLFVSLYAVLAAGPIHFSEHLINDFSRCSQRRKDVKKKNDRNIA